MMRREASCSLALNVLPAPISRLGTVNGPMVPYSIINRFFLTDEAIRSGPAAFETRIKPSGSFSPVGEDGGMG